VATVAISTGVNGCGVKLTTHLHLVPRSRRILTYDFIACSWTLIYVYVTHFVLCLNAYKHAASKLNKLWKKQLVTCKNLCILEYYSK